MLPETETILRLLKQVSGVRPQICSVITVDSINFGQFAGIVCIVLLMVLFGLF
jgi:hypothetical protein